MVVKDSMDIGPEPHDYRLEIVSRFVDLLDLLAIKYCHWKSNEHLIPAIKGDTDLDILFDNNQKKTVEKALYNAKFIRFNPCCCISQMLQGIERCGDGEWAGESAIDRN